MLRAINGGDHNLWNACPIPQEVRISKRKKKKMMNKSGT
jgi:hypothetical protein